MRYNSIYKSILSLFILVLSASCLFAKSDIDAEYKFIKHEYILNADGSQEYNYSHKLKYLSGYSINRAYGESFVVYNPEWQELKVTKSKTTMANGEKVVSPPNAFNESLPFFAAKAAPYMHLREMVVTHVGLERGCEVEFAYTIKTKAGFMPGLIDKIIAGSRSPINDMEIVIKVPTGQKLDFIIENTKADPKKSVEGAYDVYTWTFNDIPQAAIENNQPDLDEFMPTLYFSTVPNEELLARLFPKDDKLKYLDENIEKVIKEVTKDKFTDFDKCLALSEYIYENVGLAHIPPRYTGYMPLSASEVFESNVGSEIDRVNLLRAMCGKAGIESYIIIHSNSFVEKNNLIHIVNMKNLCLGTLSVATALNPNQNHGVYIPYEAGLGFYPSQKENRLSGYMKPDYVVDNPCDLRMNLYLQNDTIKGIGKISLPTEFHRGQSSEEIELVVERKMSQSGFNLESYDTQETENLKLSSKPEKLAGMTKITLPQVPGSIDDRHLNLVNAKRTTPVKLSTLVNESYSYNIEVPEDMRLAIQPKKTSIKNEVGELNLEIRQEGREIIVKRSIKINNDIIPAEKYKYLLELVNAWDDTRYRTLYLK